MSYNTPSLRFGGYNDAWEQRKFEDLVDKNDGIRRGPFGSALKKEFFVKESEYVVYEQQNAIYDRFNTRYNITKEKYIELNKFKVIPGDFIMSGAGTIGRISLVPNGIKQGIFNQALIRFKLNTVRTDSKYFLQLMRSEQMQRKLTGSNAGSAMINLVPMSEVKQWDILVPELDEQKKIGEFFTNLDNTIALHQRKLDKLKQLKQGYLQQLFPQNGKNTPRIRFANFDNKWEQDKFGNLIKEKREKTKIENEDTLLSCAIDGIYLNSELFDHFRGTSNIGYLKIKMNDMILSAQNLHLGNANINLRFEHGMISPAYKVYNLTKADPHFMSAWLKAKSTKNFFERATTEGASICRKNILWNDLYKQDLFVPSLTEQEKIASFFKQLDDTITIHQSKLDKLNSLKQVLLQKIFV
ncbi:restriction endonuclease subunit S [Lactococcus formosensis]|uniref:restriction endonuclease subunit S n=1 Tax=Lactococcus formosensis TaxID=1281486 RepID=UPI0022E431FF|nr:restriction endonuclease subunit S [Lactococcus formosensis]